MRTTSRQAFNRLRAQQVGEAAHDPGRRSASRPEVVVWDLQLRGASRCRPGRRRLAVTAVAVGCAGLATAGSMLSIGPRGTVDPTAGSTAGIAQGPWKSCGQQLGHERVPRLNQSPGTPLPPGFRVTTVVECGQRTERRTTNPAEVAALTAALREPSEPPSATGCLAIGFYLPVVLVVVDDHGRWLRPALPVAACGQPTRSVRAVLLAIAEPIVRSTSTGARSPARPTSSPR